MSRASVHQNEAHSLEERRNSMRVRSLVIVSALLLVMCSREPASPPPPTTTPTSTPTPQPTTKPKPKPTPTPAPDGTISIKGDNCKKKVATPSRVEITGADGSSTWLVTNECGHTITVEFGDYQRKRGNATGHDSDLNKLFDALSCSPSPTLKKDESALITCKVVADACRNYDYEFSVCISFDHTKHKLDPEIRIKGKEGASKGSCTKLNSSSFCKK
jgi:hypothetical protein